MGQRGFARWRSITRTEVGASTRGWPAVDASMGHMTAWRDVEGAEPEFARRVRGLFDAHRHKTIATVRADGSPRISGIEVGFEDGELVFGSMPGARKGADLCRDPRFALHSATVDPVEGSEAQWPGEAKISGRAIVEGPEGADGDRFHADISGVVHTHLDPDATMLVVDGGRPDAGSARLSGNNPQTLTFLEGQSLTSTSLGVWAMNSGAERRDQASRAVLQL